MKNPPLLLSPTHARNVVETLEARIAPAAVYAVDGNFLLSFDSASPEDVTSVEITGLGETQTIAGIDFRPATGALYLLAVGTAGAGQLYTIDTSTGEATAGAALTADPADTSNPYTALSGDFYGVDFNPIPDRLRVVSDSGQNLRINVETGRVTTDGTLNPGEPSIVAAGYTNSTASATATQLFVIDSAADSLLLQNPPNDGTLQSVGALGVDVSATAGFDILTTGTRNTAYAALTVGGATGLYSINLSTGAATALGAIGDGDLSLSGFAVAPTVISNGKSFVYRDIDGDIVTVKTSLGTLSAENFVFSGAGSTVGGVTLQLLDLNLNSTEFANAVISITAVRGPLGGDGYANVGFIDAEGIDLKSVTVDGDLGRILVGGGEEDGDAALSTLTVNSMGLFGTTTQAAGGNLNSRFEGDVSTIRIKTNVIGAYLEIATGDVNSLTVGGSLLGGTTEGSGGISVDGLLKSAKIGGSLDGDDGFRSGTIYAEELGNISVAGNLSGDNGEESGSIVGEFGLGNVKVGGSVFGGDGDDSGAIESARSIGNVSIGADLQGGSGQFSGSIYTGGETNTGAIGNISIKGNLLGGSHPLTGIISDATIGKISIGGNILGSSPTTTAKIIAEGIVDPPVGSRVPATIAGLAVKGSVALTDVLAGYTIFGGPSNADVTIGTVKVGADWVASNLVAGIDADGIGFGNDEDDVIGGGDSSSIIARIASITIGGAVAGLFGEGVPYGFVAEQIGAFRVGSTKLPLTTTPGVYDNFVVDSTGTVRVREYQVSQDV